MQQQTRTCTGGTPGQGGCPGSATQSISCTGGSCQPQSDCSSLTNIEQSCPQYTNYGYCDVYKVWMETNCAQACCLKRNGGCIEIDADPALCATRKDDCSNSLIASICKKTCSPNCNK
uniref:ShKT domain-containing protein n=1 Tax=Ciona savignyi TaxID=51511 RepID=H2YWA8_CIOSA